MYHQHPSDTRKQTLGEYYRDFQIIFAGLLFDLLNWHIAKSRELFASLYIGNKPSQIERIRHECYGLTQLHHFIHRSFHECQFGLRLSQYFTCENIIQFI